MMFACRYADSTEQVIALVHVGLLTVDIGCPITVVVLIHQYVPLPISLHIETDVAAALIVDVRDVLITAKHRFRKILGIRGSAGFLAQVQPVLREGTAHGVQYLLVRVFDLHFVDKLDLRRIIIQLLDGHAIRTLASAAIQTRQLQITCLLPIGQSRCARVCIALIGDYRNTPAPRSIRGNLQTICFPLGILDFWESELHDAGSGDFVQVHRLGRD